MKRRKKPSKVHKAPRLTITLENSHGIAKQTWIGTPESFNMSWPIEVMGMLGEHMAHYVSTPNRIEFAATLVYQGASFSQISDHSKVP